MPWQDGDYLTPTTLNNLAASASSNTGFSTNTLRAESGATISALAPSTAIIAKSVDSGGAMWNAVAYGATPSLAVDSTSAIQAALNRAAAEGGGIVFVPPGDYAISSLTVGREVTLRGAGGRDISGTPATQLFQSSANTTCVMLSDTGGSGAVIEDLMISAFGNEDNLGGVLIANMANCQLHRVALSGMSVFGVRIAGNQRTNANAMSHCVIASQSAGTCIDIRCDDTQANQLDSFTVERCYVNSSLPWVSVGTISSSTAVVPDSAPILISNRFISSSDITALSGSAVNAVIIGNRFETTNGTMLVSIEPQAGSQPFGYFLANNYAATGGVTFTDSASTPSPRWFDAETGSVPRNYVQAGTAIAPALAFASEHSLGLYRSAASNIALSYGILNLRGAALSLRTTNSAGSSSALTNGELCLVATSATSAQIAWRSGNTTYLFNADVASP